jgi:hypothetical protein
MFWTFKLSFHADILTVLGYYKKNWAIFFNLLVTLFVGAAGSRGRFVEQRAHA